MPIIFTAFQKWARDLIIRSWAVAGRGAGKTIAHLKTLGLGIRRTAGLAQYRNYAKIPARAEVMKYIPKKFAIGRAQYTEAYGVMTRRYRYTVASEFYNKQTGELKTYYTSMISDRPLSVGEIERTGSEVMRGLAGMYDATITKQWISQAEHREGDAWD